MNDDDLQLINQNVETVKRLLEEANQGIFNLIAQCEPAIASRLLEDAIGYLLLNANDGVNYALNALNNIQEQESLQIQSSDDSEQ